jgi:hypothetical protein
MKTPSVEQLRKALSDENVINELERKMRGRRSILSDCYTYYYIIENIPGKNGMKLVTFFMEESEDERVTLDYVAEHWLKNNGKWWDYCWLFDGIKTAYAYGLKPPSEPFFPGYR